MEDIIVTKDQLKEVVDRKVADQLRTQKPTNNNGFVSIKADHDARRDQARVVADYILAVHKEGMINTTKIIKH